MILIPGGSYVELHATEPRCSHIREISKTFQLFNVAYY